MSEEFQPNITVTIKGGQGFDAPWLVFHAATAEEADQAIAEAMQADLLERAAEAAIVFQASYALAKGGLTTPAPAPAQPAWTVKPETVTAPSTANPTEAMQPAGDDKACTVCGQVMTLKEGTAGAQSKNPGRPWKGLFCPAGKGHDVEWLR